MSALQEALDSGKFVVTGEAGPPKGVDIDSMLEDMEHYRGKVVAVNVTDNQSSVMRISSVAVCAKLLEKGLEPIFQMTCRDRNRLALQADLLGAYVLGIRNVLLLTGDHPTLGDHPESMPVFELDSVSLLKCLDELKNGKDMAGEDLVGAPSDIFLGATVTPQADPLEPQIYKMAKKIKAGAQFFQTQAVFDLRAFENFIKETEKFAVPVLAGIVLLKSARMAKFMNENVAGVFVPDELMERMAAAPDKEARAATSIEIAAELIRGLKDMCHGVHIMPLGWEAKVAAVLDAAGVA